MRSRFTIFSIINYNLLSYSIFHCYNYCSSFITKPINEIANYVSKNFGDLFTAEIIEKLGLKKEIFKPLSEGGSVVGNFTDEIKAEVGGDITVKLCYSHDTASAVHAIDYTDPYISSGTWSLLGVKENVAHTDMKSLKDGFSNEGGKNRTFRYQKNISGMWIINNICNENGTKPKDLVEIIDNSNYDYTYDVNKECFSAPKSMTEAIKNELKALGYPEPQTLADIARSSLKSLAKAYASSVEELETTLNKKYESIVIVGGGANNRKLNQFTEEFSNKKVIALPIEATSIGNLKAQMEE